MTTFSQDETPKVLENVKALLLSMSEDGFTVEVGFRDHPSANAVEVDLYADDGTITDTVTLVMEVR